MTRETVEAVGKMQEYVKSHINDPITLKDLARACGFSPWHAFSWADQDAPRFQLAPEGYRGYIEGRPVVQIG